MLKGAREWIILVAGGHAAGKKTVCRDLEKRLKQLPSKDIPIQVTTLNMADFTITGKELVNNPERVDFDKLKKRLKDIQVLDDSSSVVQNIVIVEGLYALYDKEIRDGAVMKVFVDSDADTRLSRWVLRDTEGDESKLGGILDCYLTKGRPEMNEFIMPTKQYADVILPRGSEESGIELISTGVLDRIREDLYVESAGHHVLHSTDSSVVDLRKESFLEQSQRFYDVS